MRNMIYKIFVEGLDDVASTVLYGGFIALVTFITYQDPNIPEEWRGYFFAFTVLAVGVLITNLIHTVGDLIVGDNQSDGQKHSASEMQELKVVVTDLSRRLVQLTKNLEAHHERESKRFEAQSTTMNTERKEMDRLRASIATEFAGLAQSLNSTAERLKQYEK